MMEQVYQDTQRICISSDDDEESKDTEDMTSMHRGSKTSSMPYDKDFELLGRLTDEDLEKLEEEHFRRFGRSNMIELQDSYFSVIFDDKYTEKDDKTKTYVAVDSGEVTESKETASECISTESTCGIETRETLTTISEDKSDGRRRNPTRGKRKSTSYKNQLSDSEDDLIEYCKYSIIN